MVLPAELANYVVAHSEFSTPLIRSSVLSSLVASEAGASGGPPPPPQGSSEDRTQDAR
jgi:hypothetical protein